MATASTKQSHISFRDIRYNIVIGPHLPHHAPRLPRLPHHFQKYLSVRTSLLQAICCSSSPQHITEIQYFVTCGSVLIIRVAASALANQPPRVDGVEVIP